MKFSIEATVTKDVKESVEANNIQEAVDKFNKKHIRSKINYIDGGEYSGICESCNAILLNDDFVIVCEEDIIICPSCSEGSCGDF